MNKIAKSTFFILFLIVTFLKGWSQKYTQGYKVTSYHLPVETVVNDILQDKNGFVWIASINGLWRYDGGEFKNYVKKETDITGITNNHITCLFEDSRGDFWVGTYGGGLLKYQRECDCFERYIHDATNQRSLSFNEVRVLYETSDHQFFVGTNGGGLNLFDRDLKQFTRYETESENLHSINHNNVLSLAESKKGELVIGTWRGLCKLDYKSGKVTRVLQHKGLEKVYYSFLFKDQGNIYTRIPNKGIFLIDLEKNKLGERKLGYNIDLMKDQQYQFWGFAGDNINVYNSNLSNKITEINLQEQFKKSYRISSVFYNKKTDVFWIADKTGSFFKTEKSERIFQPFLQGVQCRQIIESKSYFWVANPKEITLYSKKDFSLFKKIKNLSWDIYIAKDTKDLGVKGGDQKFIYHFSDEGELLKKITRGKTHNTTALLHTSTNRVWTGEILGAKIYDEDGLVQRFDCDPKDKVGISYFHRCRTLNEDKKGNIWMGTEGDGLKKYIPSQNKFVHYRHKIGDLKVINSNFVNSVFEDKNNVLWVGTDSGLSQIHLDSGEVEQINEDVLKDKIVNSIVEDLKGNFWIGTYNGLVKLNEVKKEVRILNQQDGLISNHIKTSSLLLESGEIVLNTDKGLMIFNPDKVKSSQKKPQIYFSKLWVNNELVKPNSRFIEQNIEVEEKLTLNYTDTKFEIEFRSIHFNNNQRCKYLYKLEGYDDEWTLARNTSNKATYTNIPPENYTLKVQASNEDNVWSGKVKELNIDVSPPFWQLLWVQVVFVLLMFLSIFYIARWFVLKEKQKSKFEIEKEKVKQFEEIAQMKMRFFTNVSHEIRTPLTLIMTPLQKFFEKGTEPDKKVLKMMYRNSARLMELINQVLDFRKLESKQELKIRTVQDLGLFEQIFSAFEYWASEKKIHFIKNFPDENTLSEMSFDPDVVQKIVSNLISNAIKYTPVQGEVHFELSISREHNQNETPSLKIDIRDNGPGIEEKYHEKIFERYYQLDEDTGTTHSSGIGLSLCAELVKLHKGNINLKSALGKGSHFEVTIPIGLKEGKVVATKAVAEEPLVKSQEIILIVEDNEDIRSYLAQELEANYKVVVAENGKEGVQMAIEMIPDMIISDVMMPFVDGFQLTKQLKANNLTSHIPIVLLTAKTGIENKMIGLQSGVHDYIQKPFSISEIQLKIKNILWTRRDLIQKNNETISESEKVEDSLLIQINNIIDAHLENTELNVDFLCRELAVSRSQLYRKIQSLTGKSIIEYINFYKLSLAIKLLQQGGKTVKEIAYSVGYDDSRYFSRIFKSKFGHSPTHFLRKK